MSSAQKLVSTQGKIALVQCCSYFTFLSFMLSWDLWTPLILHSPLCQLFIWCESKVAIVKTKEILRRSDYFRDFSGDSDGKTSIYNAGDQGSRPGLGRSLEKEMAIHSSTIAWKIPWKEKLGRLQSVGLQRVRYDWATILSSRRPCPSPTPGVHSNSCPLSRWCYPAISSSVVPFSS